MAVRWIETAVQDARYAIRALRLSPGFTAVAIASLALGIGATTAIFTLVNVMLLRPLPFPEANRLALAFQTITPGVFAPVDSMPWSYDTYLRLREMLPAFSSTGYARWQEYNVRRTGMPAGSPAPGATRLRAELVTPSLFSTLGATAMIGRTIVPGDTVPAATGAVAVLSEPLWRREFGGDSAVIGTTAVLDNLPVTIVGVMPASFTGIRENAELWVTLQAIRDLDTRDRRPIYDGGPGTVVGRLAPNATIALADAQLKAAAQSLSAVIRAPSFSPDRAKWSGGVVSYAEARRHPLIRPLLLVLSIAVGVVLLIVCANLAGLLLARARARAAELAVRIALGAGRWRLVRQIMTESVVLAALGAVPGVFVAYAGAATLARIRPVMPANYVLLRAVDLLQGVSLAPDWRIIAFAIALTLAVGTLFGVAPAIAASRTDITDLIKVAGNSRGTTRARGRRWLVVGQVALATTLLVGAGLMVRSFRALLHSDVGFQASNVVMLRLTGGDSTSSTSARRDELLASIAALPGVSGAAAGNCPPLSARCGLTQITRVDDRRIADDALPPAEAHTVTRDFVRTLGIPLRSGRSFDSRDVAGQPAVVLVSEGAARLLWKGQSPIGHRVSTLVAAGTAEVIGVVADVKYDGMDLPVRPAFYYAYAQFRAFGAGDVVVRGITSPATLIPAIRGLIARFDPTIAISAVTTGDEVMSRATSSTRFIATLLVSFGVGAALLASLGVYGVLAYLVTQRRREFGVRIAIGAQPLSLLALVVRQGAVLVALGLGAGVVGAAAATTLLSTFLFGVTRIDVATYAAIVIVVGIAGVLAAFIPAVRATRVDPISALRS
jgi:predicted permease